MQVQEKDKRTEALRQLNQKLLHDERIVLSIVPVGDGMALCMKL
jgi:predicted O-methyltransferase YrrM